MIIDHIGIAVKSIDKGIAHWQEVFGYKQATEVVVNSRQRVRVVFMEKEDSLTVKLISPSDEESSLHKFLAKGEGLHHLCFKCDNLEGGLSDLMGKGLRVVAAPQPGEAFANENIAFLYGKMGLNIELIDTDKRAGRIT